MKPTTLRHNYHACLFRLAIVSLAIILLAPEASGTIFKTGERVTVSHLHSIDDDLMVWAAKVTTNGVINGDLIAGGYEIETNGHVSGSENVFCFNLKHTGSTSGSLRAFAAKATIGGVVGKSLLAFCGKIEIAEDASIQHNAHIFGESISISGNIIGDLVAKGEEITITGQIGGDVELEGDRISIYPPAIIRGDLFLISKQHPIIDTAGGVVIMGKVHWSKTAVGDEGESDSPSSILASTTKSIARTLAAFLFGIIVVALFRKKAERSFEQISKRFSTSIAAGLVTLLITAFCAVTLIVAVILGAIGLALNAEGNALTGMILLTLSTVMVPITGFLAVAGSVLFYTGKIVVALLIGYAIARKLGRDARPLSKMQLLLGLIVLSLLFSIPLVGWIVYLFVGMTGSGAVILALKRNRDSQSSTGDSPDGTNSTTAT